MISIAFALLCAIIVLISYRISRSIINVVSVFTVPYMLIVPINNLLMIRRGFFSISNQVICMLGGALVCILIGYSFANSVIKIRGSSNVPEEQRTEELFTCYRIKSMLKYVLIVELLSVSRFVYIVITRGLAYLGSESFEGYMLTDTLGHLLLTIYPIIPILFLYWLHNKKKIIYLFATAVCLLLLFLTFVKYHVIGMMVLLFLFVTLEEKRYLRKGLILVTSLAIAAFVLNYLVSFLVRGTSSKVAQEFYINHFWTYMSGSVINDNRIFTAGVRTDTSLFYKLGTALFALPNLFLSTLFGISLCPHFALSFFSLGKNGEMGNVVDTFGYYFPSKGSGFDIFSYFFILVLIGIIFTVIYNVSVTKRYHFRVTVCIFMTFFMFFSFFGTFYILSPPWEIMVWSVIMLFVFDDRKTVRLGRRRLF